LESIMSLAHAGLYLRALRERQGRSRGDVVFDLRQRKLTIDERQLARIEAGEIDTRGTLLFALARILEGDYERIAQLLLSDEVSDELLQTYIREWEAQRGLISDDEKAARQKRRAAFIDTLMADPSKIDQYLTDPEKKS
jgi:hypothetical protein